MRAAISSAPVDTGDYRSKFSIRGGKDKKGLPVVYVGNDDPAAAHIEWGTKHSAFGPTPAHHTMARAMSSAREG
jgi:ribosomal protein S6E (S10)